MSMGKAQRRLLSVLLGFVALTAIPGGVALALGLDPMPPEWLVGTPFSGYLIPGLLLASVVGGSAGLALVAVIRDRETARALAAFSGCVLMGWIGVEVAILNQASAPTATEVFYFFCGLLTVAVALVGRKRVDT